MATPSTAAEPSLDEMLKILDAASALRRERELVDEQLSADEYKRRLRDRLLAAAEAAGDPVRPEEVEAAVNTYFERLHAYSDPPLSPAVLLAHAYVRRWAILASGALALASALILWWVFLDPTSPVGLVGGRERAVARAGTSVQELLAAARTLSEDPAADARIDRIAREAELYQNQANAAKLRALDDELRQLVETLEAEYTVEVIHGPGLKSGLDRYYTDDDGRRVSGYYLIVEARDASGRPVAVPIRIAEADNTTQVVSRWAERVPWDVYERLRLDKQSDGRLDEFVYAVKRRGRLDLDVRMPDSEGRPLARLGQITEW
jgi:hypothetical protein